MQKRLFFTLIMLAAVAICMGAERKFTLVIDAGHGGKDPGAKGKISYEKDINLKVALAFGRYVEQNCADVKVIYTRKTDVFVELDERAKIANRNKADLFISVHTNALEGGRISRGLETYTLGMYRAADNLNVAKRENSVILLEKDYKQTYAGFDPKSAESYIMFELMQDKHMANSVEMARLIQSEVCASSGRVNKGVHQAGFLVIRETSMPSCLIELGFITTPDEEQFLNTQEGQDKMAKGIYNAFVKYKKKYGNVKMSANDDSKPSANEDVLLAMADHGTTNDSGMEERHEQGVNGIGESSGQQMITDDGATSEAAEYAEQREVRKMAPEQNMAFVEVPQPATNPPQTVAASAPPQSQPTASQPQPAAPQPQPAAPQPQPAVSQPQPAALQPQPAPEIKKDTTPVPTPINKTVSEPQKETAKPAAEPQKETAKPAAEPQKETVKPAVEPQKEIAKPAAEPQKETAKPKEEIPVHGPVFKVQIAAASQQVATTSSVFQGVENIDCYEENGMYKYTIGASPDFDEISNLRKNLLDKFPQAFIIAFKDGVKTDLAKAIREFKTIKNKKD